MGWRFATICGVLPLAACGGNALASPGDFTIQAATSAGEPIVTFKRALRLLDGQLPASSTTASTEPYIAFMKHTNFGDRKSVV